MRLPIVLPLLALLSFGGCSKPADNNTKAAEAISDMHYQPGQYQSKVAIKKLDLPGMPAQFVEAMKTRMLDKPVTYCLTPEDAAKGAEDMKQRMAKGPCQFDKFNASGGKIDAEMTCKKDGKIGMHMIAHGTYTDTGNVMEASSDVPLGPTGTMHIEQVTTTTRIGECTKP